jgi:hypothetical protein
MKRIMLMLLLLALTISTVLGCGVKGPDGKYLNPGPPTRGGHALGEPIPLEPQGDVG